MLVIGKNDVFEQEYMTKFEKIAGDYGIFVKYERDRAARDLGLHLTKDVKSGEKQLTNSVVWFQMKGVMTTTLSAAQFKEKKGVSLSMKVEHLRHWFLDKEPTQLVVYIQATDQFLIMNLRDYVAKTWGRDILTLNQETATVKISDSSVLDKQAFSILLRYAEIAQWMRALGCEYDDATRLNRDHRVIYALGTADTSQIQLGVLWTKWLSKMRDELRIAERPVSFDGEIGEGWEVIHEHWEFGGIDPEDSYPYLDIFALQEYDPEVSVNCCGEEELAEDGMTVTLRNGDKVFGPNASNEYCYFVFGALLNEYGKKLFNLLTKLVAIKLLEVGDAAANEHTYLSVAPWHSRDV